MAILKLSQLDEDVPYSYQDYLSWQFSERVELIKGYLFRMSPAPNLAHQRITTALTALFWQHFSDKSCHVFTAPFDVQLFPDEVETATIVQPDLCVVCDDTKLVEQGCKGAPDLIVEVLSPGNSKKEMREKYEVYQTAGVREYWLVSPYDKVVWVYVLKDGQYVGRQPYTEEQAISPEIFPQLSIDLAQVML
ncbi:MAG: Uma2 family endonuclease [Bacteroidota bacterium]